MINSNNKKNKRTEPLTEKELELLKKLSKSATTFSDFAHDVRVERSSLTYTIMRGSAAPITIKKIRKFLETQTVTN